jgi:hypothetical protein
MLDAERRLLRRVLPRSGGCQVLAKHSLSFVDKLAGEYA